MSIIKENDYILSKQFWDEYQEYIVELEDQTVLNELNKLHNRKGYTLADYQNNYDNY